jgi:O-antigen/teichoic acid export membrane protein
MMSGTAIAQIISVLMYPIIARIYDPQEFGLYVLFNAILGILVGIGALKYENAIPLVKSTKKTINLFNLCIILLVSTSFILFIVLYTLGHELLVYLNASQLAEYRYLLVPAFFFSTLYLVASQLAFREHNFKQLALTRVTRSLSLNISQLLLGLLKFSKVGLIIGKIIGEASGNLLLIRKTLQDSYSLNFFSWTQIKSLGVKYIKFPLFSAASHILNRSSLELPTLFFTSFYGSETVGFYGLAFMIMTLPLNLIGNAIGDVFYAESAKHVKSNPLRILAICKSLQLKLILIGIIPFIATLFFGPFLFKLVFSEQWRTSGEFAQILAILVYARFVINPITRIFIVFEKQILGFIFDLIRVLVIIATFLMVKNFNLGIYHALLYYSISMTIIYLVTELVVLRILITAILRKN